MSDLMYVLIWALAFVVVGGGTLLGILVSDKIMELQEKRKNSKKSKENN